MNEQSLIEKIANGDQSALETLHQSYYERLVRFLYRLTSDKEHIIEIVNDTFLAVWKGAKTFRQESAVSTWIMGIAYKKGLQSVSRQKKLYWIGDNEELAEEDDFISERHNAQLLERLSPQHRAVMELTYYFGYSYKEIGVIVGCPENTVKTRMFHGRQRLRGLMEDLQNANS